MTTSLDKHFWDDTLARKYVHNSDLQRRWAWAMLPKYRWKGNEHILDIGCGDGKISADLSQFVPQGSLTGVDASPAMIQWAKRQYIKEEYPNLSFIDGNALDFELDRQFDVAVSFCVLPLIEEKEIALRNIAKHLKPGGTFIAAVLRHANKGLINTILDVWDAENDHFNAEQFPNMNRLDENQYAALLEKTGFTVERAVTVPTKDPFVDEIELANWIDGVTPPYIAKTNREESIKRVVDLFLERQPEIVQPDGSIHPCFHRTELIAVKKTH